MLLVAPSSHSAQVTHYGDDCENVEEKAKATALSSSQTRHKAWVRRSDGTPAKWNAWRPQKKHRLSAKRYAMNLDNQVFSFVPASGLGLALPVACQIVASCFRTASSTCFPRSGPVYCILQAAQKNICRISRAPQKNHLGQTTPINPPKNKCGEVFSLPMRRTRCPPRPRPRQRVIWPRVGLRAGM